MSAVATQGPGAADMFFVWLARALRAVRSTGRRGLALTSLGVAVGVGIALTLPAQWTSSAAFIAQGASTLNIPSALQGLVASVGITSAKEYSPQFYADLLASRPVLEAAVLAPYRLPAGDSSVPASYVAVEHLAKGSLQMQLAAGVKRLGERVAARADVRTNIITVDVTARYPTLARDIARTLLTSLDSLNIGFRQQQSRQLREYFEGRVVDMKREVDSAENALLSFMEQNRVAGSPELQMEQLRLQRNADLKRALYTTVSQQYEEARMQEARNVPVLTVLEPPNLPIKKSGPPRRFIVVVGAAFGLALALLLPSLSSLRDRLRSAVDS